MDHNKQLPFKWKYVISYVLAFLKKTSSNNQTTFVTHSGTKEWILGAKARRLSRFSELKTEVHYTPKYKDLPKSDKYFFLHQKYFARCLRYNPHLWKSKCIVMFTHAEWTKSYSPKHIGWVLSKAHKVVCLNSDVAKLLSEIGVPKNNIEIMHLATDATRFTARPTKEGKVGFSMAYYERKNPKLLYDIVSNMPHKEFLLVGKDWHNYEKFDELLKKPNFEYIENPPYDDYNDLYHQMEVFVSTSFLEGGPVPLLEAMMCNVVPVVSNTGFCPDIVIHGENGFLFDPKKDSSNYVCNLIDKALDLKSNVRSSVEEYTWINYAVKIDRLFLQQK